MNFLKIFEDRVSGIFGASRAPFSFKKLAKQATHELEDQTLVVNGVDTAPALFTILVSKNDDALLAQYYPQLTTELAELVKAHADKRKYSFVGKPLVRFMVDPVLKPGKFSVFAENVDAPTLARLYEEERVYAAGSQQGPAPMAGGAAPGEGFAAGPARGAFTAQPAGGAAPDPFAPAMPATVSRGALAGRSGAPLGAAPAAPSAPAAVAPEPGAAPFAAPAAAGAGAVAGAAAGSIAANMVGGSAQRAAHLREQGPEQQQAGAPMAELVDVVSGQAIAIEKPRTIVGRERASADVILRDPNVSRRHAELSYTGSGWSIEDLNSTNGTSVNNRRVTRCPLRSGDLVTFGLTTFEFRG